MHLDGLSDEKPICAIRFVGMARLGRRRLGSVAGRVELIGTPISPVSTEYAQERLVAGCRVISADTKKKELATRLIPGSSVEVDHRDPWRQLSPLVMGNPRMGAIGWVVLGGHSPVGSAEC